jgi:hypothetical protein
MIFKSVILSGGEVLRTAVSFLRSVAALRRSEPQSKDPARRSNMWRWRQKILDYQEGLSPVVGAEKEQVPLEEKGLR